MGVSEFRRSVMIWAKEETMSRNEIEAVQLERLKDTVKRVYEHVPAYRAKMDAAGVSRRT